MLLSRLHAASSGWGLARVRMFGILANDGRELVTALFGAALANCVAVPLNARHKSRELGFIIENADLGLILTTAADTRFVDFRAVLTDALPSLGASTSGANLSLTEAPAPARCRGSRRRSAGGFPASRADFTEAAHSVPVSTVEAARRATRLRSTAFIIYTSGTTAIPKAACSPTKPSHAVLSSARAAGFVREHDVTWGGGPLFTSARSLRSSG